MSGQHQLDPPQLPPAAAQGSARRGLSGGSRRPPHGSYAALLQAEGFTVHPWLVARRSINPLHQADREAFTNPKRRL
jgi:hypothetical protein